MENDALTADRRRRVELLAAADAAELTELADDLLGALGTPTVEGRPDVGLVMLQVREPVCRERFHLGEVAVARARVQWHGASGWAMRVGTDREAALSAALCDAAAQIDDAARTRIDALCDRTDEVRRRASEREWSELATTRVVFEELDS